MFINEVTLEYPLTERQVREAFPDKTLPQVFVCPEGFAEVSATEKPSYNPVSHSLAEGVPELVGGQWQQTWTLVARDQADADDRLSSARDAAWESIKQHRTSSSNAGGYKVAVGGVDKWFHSDAKSQTQQLGLARRADRIEAAGGDMDAVFAGNGPGGLLYWKTMDGSYVPMTASLAQAVFDAAEAQDMAIFAAAEQHGAAMRLELNPAEYDYSGGWPEVFTPEE